MEHTASKLADYICLIKGKLKAMRQQRKKKTVMALEDLKEEQADDSVDLVPSDGSSGFSLISALMKIEYSI